EIALVLRSSRPSGDRLPVLGGCGRVPSFAGEEVAELAARVGEIRPQLQRAPILGDRAVDVAALEEEGAQLVVRDPRARVGGERRGPKRGRVAPDADLAPGEDRKHTERRSGGERACGSTDRRLPERQR